MAKKSLTEIEEEYTLSLQYLNELRKVYDEKGFEVPGREREAPVINVWKDLVEKMVILRGNREEVYTVVSRDFQRFFTSFLQFSNILETMWKSNGNQGSDKKKYEVLIRKIVDIKFFEEIFHDDSNNFFKLRKYVRENLNDKELRRKVNSHLDCIVTGLFRQLKRRYGLAGNSRI